MAYAIKADGSWRAVNSEMVLAADESYSETMPEPSQEVKRAEVLQAFEALVDAFIQKTIQSHNYKGIERAPLYVDDPEWGAEAKAMIAWNKAVWHTAYAVMNACLAGERAIPTPEKLIAELPRLVVE